MSDYNNKEKKCPFCDTNKIKDRIFYEKDGWIAFLDARPYAKGHTILSAKTGDNCPEKLSNLKDEQLATLGSALQDVSHIIKKVYSINNKIKDILFASLRGNIKHFHFHLIPLYEEDEKQWRLETLYEKGHLFEYLGKLEQDGVEKTLKQRIEKGWTEEDQRKEILEKLKLEVECLRNVTGYKVEL